MTKSKFVLILLFVVSFSVAFGSTDNVESRYSAIQGTLDVDGDGEADALTDGLLILRYLFGLRGDALTVGVVSSEATRSTSQMEQYLEDMLPEQNPSPVSPPSVSLTTSFPKGYTTEPFTIYWTSTNATSCTASGIWSGEKGTSGSLPINWSSGGNGDFILTCTGDGGTASDSVNIDVFDYRRVIDDIPADSSRFSWTLGSIADYNSGYINGVYSDFWLSNYAITGTDFQTSVTEPSDSSFRIQYSGTDSLDRDIDFDFLFTDNITAIPLYDVGATEPSFVSIVADFPDSDVYMFSPLPDKQLAEDILYVSFAQLGVEPKNIDRSYVLPTIYGDWTYIADLPSGSRQVSLSGLAYLNEYDLDVNNTYNIDAAVTGSGVLTFDFDNGTVSGAFVLQDFMDLTEFLTGNGPDAVYTVIPNYDVEISATYIDGFFTGSAVLNDPENDVYLIGLVTGFVFGPDGREVAATFTFRDNDGENSEDYFFGGGLFIGE
jgi:hypothetical protein